MGRNIKAMMVAVLCGVVLAVAAPAAQAAGRQSVDDPHYAGWGLLTAPGSCTLSGACSRVYQTIGGYRWTGSGWAAEQVSVPRYHVYVSYYGPGWRWVWISGTWYAFEPKYLIVGVS